MTTNSAEKVETAAKLRAHVSMLASTKMYLALATWNDIASDILDAADEIQSHAALLAERDALKALLESARSELEIYELARSGEHYNNLEINAALERKP